MKVKLITPSWFCMWVERAISMLDDIINNNEWKKVYCVHEIVHNPNVVNYFKQKWVVFVDNYEDIEDKQNSILTFSAHWINKFTLKKVLKDFYKVINLECPLVTKVYNEGKIFVERWKTIFYIWKKWHQEAEQIVEFIQDLWWKVYVFLRKNQIPKLDKNTEIAVLNQTTLNYNYFVSLIWKITKKYPNTESMWNSDICKATFDRQTALKNSLNQIDSLIVIWWKNSSNTKELVKIWEETWKKVFFIQSSDEIENIKKDLQNYEFVGITAWASTPTNEIYKAWNILNSN